tara:strand:+ start:582 stop:764 length:183 start_codon:yes stop_codon:yes gene_type:complete
MPKHTVDLTNYENYEKGRVRAKQDVLCPDFDVSEAIASFDNDPADSPFERGYLRGLKEVQ